GQAAIFAHGPFLQLPSTRFCGQWRIDLRVSLAPHIREDGSCSFNRLQPAQERLAGRRFRGMAGPAAERRKRICPELHPMFRKLSENAYASPQIGATEIAQAKALGIAVIVNNRPEGESADQTPGPEIEAAAKAAGIDYVAIPVTSAGFSQGQVEAMAK